MRQAWVNLMIALILALGGSGVGAQQTTLAEAAKKKQPRKAKKVWTNDDFPERPALREEIKAESGLKEEPVSKKEAALKEALEELDSREVRAQGEVDWLQGRREELLTGIRALEKRMSAASSQLEQLAINAQFEEKRKELLKLDNQLAMDRTKLGEIQRSKKELLPQPEPVDYGLRIPPEEKAKEKKQGP